MSRRTILIVCTLLVVVAVSVTVKIVMTPDQPVVVDTVPQFDQAPAPAQAVWGQGDKPAAPRNTANSSKNYRRPAPVDQEDK